MRRLLLILSALGCIAAGPSFASPSLRPLLPEPAAVDRSAPLPALQYISNGRRQTSEEHKANLWAHGRPRDEVRGLGMSQRRWSSRR